MEISDIQLFNGKIEITFCGDDSEDCQTIIISESDGWLISEFVNNI